MRPEQVRDPKFWTDDMIGYNHRSFLARDDEAVAFFSSKNIPVVDVRMQYARADAHQGSRSLVGKFTPTAPNDSQWLPATPNDSLRLQTHAVVGSQ